MTNKIDLGPKFNERLEAATKEIEAHLKNPNTRDNLLEAFFNTNHIDFEEPENLSEFFDMLEGFGCIRIIRTWERYKAAYDLEAEETLKEISEGKAEWLSQFDTVKSESVFNN